LFAVDQGAMAHIPMEQITAPVVFILWGHRITLPIRSILMENGGKVEFGFFNRATAHMLERR
jgi:hypothetical protein